MKSDYTAKGTAKKASVIDELTDKVNKAKAMVVVDYRGLKHKQLESVRRELKKVEGELVVAKNRLLLRVLGDKKAALETALSDTTATVFAYADEIAPIKAMLKFFKTAGIGKTKAGLLGSTALTDADVAKLATLPPKEMLLGQLVGQLNAPIQGLHYALQWNMNKLVWALNSIKEKKT